MKTRRILLFLVIAVAAGAGLYILQNSDGNGLPPGIAMGNGRVEAVQVDVSTKHAGRVSEVLVREGDLIEIGQVVARIDITELQAQLARAEADVASAESQVAAAEADVARAKAQLALAEQELERAARLLPQGFATEEAYDIRLTERDVAVSSVAAAEAALVSRRRSVDAANAVAAEIRARIEDGVLRSPVMGRVLYRLAEPGEVLGSGGKVLTLVNHDDIYMEIFLPASQAHLVSVGSEARIKLDIAEFGIPATVSFVSPESQFTPKQVETASERDKLMFRIKIRVMPELVQHNIERVKTGLRGVAYVQLEGGPAIDWSSFLPELPPEARPSEAIGTNGT